MRGVHHGVRLLFLPIVLGLGAIPACGAVLELTDAYFDLLLHKTVWYLDEDGEPYRKTAPYSERYSIAWGTDWQELTDPACPDPSNERTAMGYNLTAQDGGGVSFTVDGATAARDGHGESTFATLALSFRTDEPTWLKLSIVGDNGVTGRLDQWPLVAVRLDADGRIIGRDLLALDVPLPVGEHRLDFALVNGSYATARQLFETSNHLSMTLTPVPEPTAAIVAALGVLGWRRRRREKQRPPHQRRPSPVRVVYPTPIIGPITRWL